MKKVITLLLSLALLLSILPVSALATEWTEAPEFAMTATREDDTITLKLYPKTKFVFSSLGFNVAYPDDKVTLVENMDEEDENYIVVLNKVSNTKFPTMNITPGNIAYAFAAATNTTFAAEKPVLTVHFTVNAGVGGKIDFAVTNLNAGQTGDVSKIYPSSEFPTASVTISGGVTPPAHTCTLTKVDAKAATCTEDGNIEYYQCSDPTCGKLYKDAAGTQEITKADTVIKAGHKYGDLIPEVSATCGKDGVKAHYECSVCHKNFDTNYAELTDLVIPATGEHIWDLVEKEVEGATTHTKECKVCGMTEEETHDKWPGDEPIEWTSNDDYHWHKFACGTIMDKAAHTWDAGVETTPATCTKAGEKTLTCTECGHEKIVTIPKADHQYKWTNDETNHWQECTVCGDIIDKAEHTYAPHKCEEAATCTKAECGYVKPAGQHTWNDGVVTKEATCAEPGEKTFTCKVCSETKTEPIKAPGHSLTKVEAVAATCTEGGNNEYYTCSVCKKVFKADKTTETTVTDETLAALGHSMTKIPAKAATCTEPGNSEYYTCGTCGKFFSDEAGKTEIAKDSWVIDALKHDFTGAWVNTDAAGHYHKCTRCDATDTVIKHTYSGKACTEADNCTVCGYAKAPGVHAWGTVDYQWSVSENNNMGCTATVKCTNCEAVEADTAIVGSNIITPATCTEAGMIRYTATFSSELFAPQTKEDPIPALGHTLTKVEAKAATCTEVGNREYYTCGTCGKFFSDKDGKTEIAKDSWVINALGHKLTRTAAKAATCTEPGNNEYYTCGTCGKFFSDKDGKNEIAKDSWVINALGHSMTKTDAKAATCTEPGNSKYYTCGNCGKFFSDADGKTEIVKDSWVIKALDHDFTGAWVNTDAAGHYHKCSRCDATDTVIKHTYSGKPCDKADNCTVCGYVKAAGVHAWGTAEYKWGDDNKSCTATVKCTNCEAVETDAAAIGINTTPATCTVDGKTVYTATFSSELFTTKTKEVTIDKLGHTYGAPVWSWSEDGKTATATFTCTREGCTAETTGHAQTVTATVSGKQNVAPTCTDKGTTTYTAKVTFEKKDYADTKNVQDIKALGHKLTKTAAKAATCEAAGNKEYYTCGTCGKFFSDKDGKNEIVKDSWVINAPGHTLTKTAAVTPTCAAGGNNEYWTCSVCHKVFKADKTTETTVAKETLAKNPANHTGETEQRGAVAASCMTAGRKADTYCKGCGVRLSVGELIDPTGNHNYVNGVCTTCGNKQPANGDTIKAAIEKVVADAKEAVEKVLDEAIKNETDANTKKILEKLKSYVSGSSKLQAVYNVTMKKGEEGDTPLANGETLADAQNVTIAISKETYNALKSGAKIVESYLVDDTGNAQTREINATLNEVKDEGGKVTGYTVTFAADRTAAYGLMTKTSSGGPSSGSGSSYTSGQSFTTDLPADSINRVTVNGKKLDSKYYTVSSNGSGSIVTLTDAYLATLKAGKYTVKIENKTHVSTGTFTIKADGTLSSPKTADAGIALYAVMAVSSLMGTAVVSKKRRKA